MGRSFPKKKLWCHLEGRMNAKKPKKTFIIVLVLFPEAEMEAGIIILVFFKRHPEVVLSGETCQKAGEAG